MKDIKPKLLDKNTPLVCKRIIPAGKEYQPHWHNLFEFEIIISGEGSHTYNANVYPVKRGSAYMMTYYDFHALSAITDITLWSIHFDEDMIGRELANAISSLFNKFHCDFDVEQTENILKFIDKLYAESTDKNLYGDFVIKNLVSQIVIEMIRKCSPIEDKTKPMAVRDAIAYVNANFKNPITLELTAKRLSFSPNYLGHMFKTQTGLSFNEYLNNIRLKYACSLLEGSDLSVKETAFQSGYSSVEYFMYVFKNKINMTPLEYKKTVRR